MRGQTAIAGLGMTEMGKVYGRTATDFAAEALALALDDAGLVTILRDLAAKWPRKGQKKVTAARLRQPAPH